MERPHRIQQYRRRTVVIQGNSNINSNNMDIINPNNSSYPNSNLSLPPSPSKHPNNTLKDINNHLTNNNLTNNNLTNSKALSDHHSRHSHSNLEYRLLVDCSTHNNNLCLTLGLLLFLLGISPWHDHQIQGLVLYQLLDNS